MGSGCPLRVKTVVAFWYPRKPSQKGPQTCHINPTYVTYLLLKGVVLSSKSGLAKLLIQLEFIISWMGWNQFSTGGNWWFARSRTDALTLAVFERPWNT